MRGTAWAFVSPGVVRVVPWGLGRAASPSSAPAPGKAGSPPAPGRGRRPSPSKPGADRPGPGSQIMHMIQGKPWISARPPEISKLITSDLAKIRLDRLCVCVI